MQRADDPDIQRCRLLEKSLHLSAVFTDDADIIAASLASPVLFYVKCAELTKAIGREKHLVCGIIRDNNLRPMHHGSRYKSQCVLTEGESISFTHHHATIREIRTKEVLHHREGFL